MALNAKEFQVMAAFLHNFPINYVLSPFRVTLYDTSN